MATSSRNKSYQRSLLFSAAGVFLVFAIFVTGYQYRREKEFKVDILHSRLQAFNYSLVNSLGHDAMSNDSSFRAFVAQSTLPNLRVSLISLDGRVLVDSHEDDVAGMGDHSNRVEVRDAILHGSGYDIKRLSESTRDVYFYSATRFDDIVVRSAVPYSSELTESLKADHTFIYYMLAMTVVFGLLLYYFTHRITKHIGYLREFAEKADSDDNIDHELERQLPDDELGDISHTIITLYWKLRQSEHDKARIKRQLTENAAHELKTPAASINGFLESILDNPDMDRQQERHFLERCYAQSQRLTKLLQDMSTLTRLDNIKDNGLVAQDDVEVAQVVRSVLADTSQQLEAKGITPVVDIADDIVVKADNSLIYGIFRNLADNAIAYATGATTISITAEREERRLVFTFADNGVGVAPQHLEHLFERFYRIDKGRSRKMGGTGLGLSIVRNSVLAHGGNIEALTTPGGGLTVRWWLKM